MLFFVKYSKPDITQEYCVVILISALVCHKPRPRGAGFASPFVLLSKCLRSLKSPVGTFQALQTIPFWFAKLTLKDYVTVRSHFPKYSQLKSISNTDSFHVRTRMAHPLSKLERQYLVQQQLVNAAMLILK